MHRIKKWLKWHNACSREQLAQCFKDALNKLDVEMFTLDRVPNVRDLLKPYINKATLITYPQVSGAC